MEPAKMFLTQIPFPFFTFQRLLSNPTHQTLDFPEGAGQVRSSSHRCTPHSQAGSKGEAGSSRDGVK